MTASDEITSDKILVKAAEHIRQRAAQRDCEATGERSMAKTVQAFNAIFGHQVTEEQGWQFMTLLKIARSSAGGYNPDDYEDGAAYFALAGETADRVHKFKQKHIVIEDE
ncbi:hypothetical protein GCM10023116_43480 [Kistimonas scapharcae]|uniref:DUF6378 domain-containing protein n=1 Tax=Kistimonas scapharcae TaxID=1036133 RepID=A0ABP8V9E9_9GAMM